MKWLASAVIQQATQTQTVLQADVFVLVPVSGWWSGGGGGGRGKHWSRLNHHEEDFEMDSKCVVTFGQMVAIKVATAVQFRGADIKK